jgi:hypothetical protein
MMAESMPGVFKKRSQMTKKLSKTKIFIFAILATTISIGVLEGVSYLLILNFAETGTFNNRVLQNNFHPFRGWENPANARITAGKPALSDVYIETDEFGRSITPLSYSKPKVHVAITGASTVFGIGASSNETTLPSMIERLVYELYGIEAEVTNLAGRGYQSFQEMLTLREFYLKNHADVVIAISGPPDAKWVLEEPHMRSALLVDQVYKNAVDLVRRAERQQTIIMNPMAFLRSYSSFVDLIARAAYRVVGTLTSELDEEPSVMPSDEIIERRALSGLMNYHLMDAMTKFQGGRFFAILTPTRFSWRGGKTDNSKAAQRRLIKMKKAVQNKMYKVLRSNPDLQHVYDLSGALDQEEADIFIDLAHLSDKGTKALAIKVLEVIQPALAMAAAK